MPRKRNRENAGFPTGWKWSHGAIYYNVPRGLESLWDGKKTFRLGSSVMEAYITWAQRLGSSHEARTVGDLLVRYLREITYAKPPQSRKSDLRSYKILYETFHDTPINAITPLDIYKYLDKRSAKIAGRREKAMLSHAYTKAVEWGYVERHPFRGEVRLEGEEARTRYVTDDELAQIMNLKPKKKGDPLLTIQAYLRLKMLIGLRQGDMLRLPQFRGKIGDIIPLTTQKTGKRIELEVTEAVHLALRDCMAVRPKDIAPWLFCNRLGKPYFNDQTGDASSWQSNWQRFKKRVKDELGIEGFTEHDFRAKVGSDQPDAESAQKLLTHDSVATTRRAYRRKPERIRPVR